LIRTPGRWRVAGVNFGFITRKTTGRVGRKNGPSRDDWLASLDPGVAPYVDVLDAAGIETYESCEGGEGHSYAEPAVRFYGERGQGFRALAIALQHGFPVRALRRIWTVDEDGHPHGPRWELAFWRGARC
jgi:hypothetical protein